MRLQTLLGGITLWLGVVFLANTLLIGELSLGLQFLADIIAGTLFLIAGTGFILGKGEIPEDTGENIFPRKWLWYLMTAGFAVVAIRHTSELFDLGVL